MSTNNGPVMRPESHQDKLAVPSSAKRSALMDKALGSNARNSGCEKGVNLSALKDGPIPLRVAQNDPTQKFRKIGLQAMIAKRIERYAEERLSPKQIFKRFTESSTLHGFRYIFTAGTIVRRFSWFVLCVTMTSLFLSELQKLIMLYSEYPFTTTTTLESVQFHEFPSISICNTNSFRKSISLSSGIDHLVFDGSSGSSTKPTSNTTSDVIDGNVLFEKLNASSHQIEDMLIYCSFIDAFEQGKHVHSDMECGPHNYTAYTNLAGALCYRFNPGPTFGVPLLSVTNTGILHGLKVYVKLQTDDYSPQVQEAGLQLVLHDHDENPLSFSPFVVPPGFQTYVEMKKQQVLNLPPPYKTHCGSRTLNISTTYRRSMCYIQKLSEFVLERCGCKGPFMEKSVPYQVPLCNSSQYKDCYRPTINSFDPKTAGDQCPVDCIRSNYMYTLSYGRFIADPKIGTYPSMTAKRNINLARLNMSYQDQRQYIRDNFVAFVIYFSDMTVENISQERSYDIYKLMGDIGGQLGLMLGASVLTVIEFIDLIFFIVYTKISRIIKRRQVNRRFPTPAESKTTTGV